MRDMLADAGLPAGTSAGTSQGASRARLRTGLWIGLCLSEMLTISWLFESPLATAMLLSPFYYLRQLAVLGLLAGAAFVLMAWPRRHGLAQAWVEGQRSGSFRGRLIFNVIAFSVLLAATLAISKPLEGRELPASWLFGVHGLALAVTAVSLVGLDIPLKALWQIARAFATELTIAVAAGLSVLVFAFVTASAWDGLAGATLHVVSFILKLYESDVHVDTVERWVRVGYFVAIINWQCSGHEGIALVTGFLSIYFWVFRDTLSFPRAFLLYPIGIASIWLLNAVRIALLTSLGGHVSPQMASDGFHSQAGWVAFLIATLVLMALAERVTWFKVRPSSGAGDGLAAGGDGSTAGAAVPPADGLRDAAANKADDRLMLAYVAPFIGLMIGAIVMSATAPHDLAFYPVKVAAVLVALWLFRDVWRPVALRVPWEGVVAGLAVAAAWIATDPDPAAGDVLKAWLDGLGPGLAAGWIALRVFGASITVPIAEELAFRGFLYRWIVRRNFPSVSYAHLSVMALVVSSLLFGLMHGRMIAAVLAGVVFALVMLRTRSLAGAVVAHMVANLAICAWALAFGQWSLF